MVIRLIRLQRISWAKMNLCLWLLLAFTLPVFAADPDVEYIQKELAWGTPVNLELFGGPHIEVSVRDREISYVAIQTADYTRMIPVPRTNIQSVEVDNRANTATVVGSTSVTMQPTRDSRNVEKKDGIDLPGSNSTMYLLFRDPSSGIRIYLLDAISSQNHDSIVIAVPKPPQSSVSSSSPLLRTNPSSPPAATAIDLESKSEKGLNPISPELFSQYIALQDERETLDISKTDDVAIFNRHVAAYNEELKKARASKAQTPTKP